MAKMYPETMQEFLDCFPTEESCRQYIAKLRWGNSVACPNCASCKSWGIRRNKMRCSRCHRDISITAGTVFESTHIPLRLWFQGIWCVASQKNGVSALGLSRVLGIKRQKTGWDLLHKIRLGMVRPGRERLTGTVEVDEVLIGGKRHKLEGRSQPGKILALIAAEDKKSEGIGRIRIQIIPDATSRSLHMAIKDMIEPKSVVRTDGWTSYWGIERYGYIHKINKRQPRIPGDDPTPLIHRISALLKRWLLGTHQGGVKETHLHSYLDEFVFRFNRRTSHSRGKLFYRLLQNLVAISS